MSLTIVLVALVGLPEQVEGQEGTDAYQLDESWFKLPAGQQFANETGITVDDEGMVYTARRCRVNCGYIQKGAPLGTSCGSIRTEALRRRGKAS